MNIRDTIVDSLPAPLRRGLSSARQNVLGWTRTLGNPEYVVNHGVKIRLGAHLTPMIRESLIRGNYEGGELKPLRLFLKPMDRVFEVGTGIGFISLYCAGIVGEENVFTYEANPNNERFTEDNYRLNGLWPELTIGMLAKEAGHSVKFYADSEYWSSSSVKWLSSSEEILIPTISASAELTRTQPTCLVVDIEGGEYELFRHLSLDGIRMIVVELHPYIIGEKQVSEVRQVIEQQGFQIGWMCDDRHHICYIKQ